MPKDQLEPLADLTSFESIDPRCGEVIAEFPIQQETEVQAVVAAARDNAQWWAGLGFAGRRRHLTRWRQLILARFDELAELVSTETGKPDADARIEVVLGVDHLHWATKHAKPVLRRRFVKPGMLMFNHLATVEYQPLGIVGVIGPWNYPVFTPMGSIAYALAAGNTVVFKPSEYTTRVGQWLVETFLEALGDEGALRTPLRLITGGGATGADLCSAGIDKLAFTGSTATGKRVMSACAQTLTPVLMECGGKDALLVDSDANLKAAADAAVWGSLSNAGQTCVGVERVYVVDSVAEKFIALVTEQVAALRVGGSADADLGPITMPSQLSVIEAHINQGISSGGQLLMGGTLSIRPPYVPPVVLVDVPEDSEAMTNETFGPVIIINRVASIEAAVALANGTRYGLGATVFARRNGQRIARQLRVGMVGLNSILPFVVIPALPFGGVGESGFGRIHGADGLREFCRAKSVARKMFPALVTVTSFRRPPWAIKALTLLAKTLYR